ncbi:hypothetical protein EX30DRAFT_373245 [Ascodesmis nigricans]|uniref:Uncharacterized protein n=1 Tax=Ascodesmis nigricans TaxID=341454 RepID=A0A4S2MRZ2_9PEZI|nr:hypothetical protein EX30DRAFT_373245 [Ascodesmis nigricans]
MENRLPPYARHHHERRVRHRAANRDSDSGNRGATDGAEGGDTITTTSTATTTTSTSTAPGGGATDRPRQFHPQFYGVRIPSIQPGQRPSLYDWAPIAVPLPTSDSSASPEVGLPPISAIERNRGREVGLPQAVALGRLPVWYRYEPPPSPPPQGNSGESPFRMAVMQSLRNNNPRRTGRRRESQDGEGNNNNSNSNNSNSNNNDGIPRFPWRDAADPFGFHDSILHPPSTSTSSTSSTSSSSSSRYHSSVHSDGTRDIVDAIHYLSTLRRSSSREESLHLATSTIVQLHNDYSDLLHLTSDLLLDTRPLTVAETSWLKVGGVFWGTQRTPPPIPPHRLLTLGENGLRFHHPESPLFHHYHHANPPPPPPGEKNTNSWTVKVHLTSIDYSTMRLTGTMEAFPEWQKGSTNTYLEGEIVDFNTYTLETTTMGPGTTTIEHDARNWRRVEPFCGLRTGEVVRGLLSRSFMRGVLEEWVLMRWKEKHFLPSTDPPDSDSSDPGSPDSPDLEDPNNGGGGLTIGGFYYLSLRREDGRIGGFYHDVVGAPNQRLELRPQKRLFPSYQFR